MFNYGISKHANRIEMVDIVYTALATLMVVVVLHVGVFLVTRFIQPPKPKVVYLPSPAPMQPPQQPQQLLPSPAPLAAPPPPPPPPSVTLPTYDAPPQKPQPPSLPPPIETRESRQTALPIPGPGGN